MSRRSLTRLEAMGEAQPSWEECVMESRDWRRQAKDLREEDDFEEASIKLAEAAMILQCTKPGVDVPEDDRMIYLKERFFLANDRLELAKAQGYSGEFLATYERAVKEVVVDMHSTLDAGAAD